MDLSQTGVFSHALAFSAGLLGKVVGSGFLHFSNSTLLPYISRQTNPHIRIEGKWKVRNLGQPTDGDGLQAEWNLLIDIKQNGLSVNGSATAECVKGSSKGKIVDYKASGTFSNNVLDLTLLEKGDSNRNRSVFLLQVVGEGNKLGGHRLFLGRNKNDIRAIPCEWVRSNYAESECGTA
jgi:hypothetical protein